MKFKGQPIGQARPEGEREMAAAAAEITYGEPVNIEFGGAFADLGAEQRDGRRFVVLALDDGEGTAHVDLTPEQCAVLADVLAGLARVSA
jgi:Ser/Thr protein kinase RdoA (MazF antagonist)